MYLEVQEADFEVLEASSGYLHGGVAYPNVLEAISGYLVFEASTGYVEVQEVSCLYSVLDADLEVQEASSEFL